MQNPKTEELELDMEELKLLLNRVEEDDKLIPLVKCHINRFINTLEVIRDGLGQSVENEPVLTENTIEERIPAPVLGEQLRPAAELAKGLTLNDTFRFSRELFNGDKDEMNKVLQEISRMTSLPDVISYLSTQIEWDEDNEAVKDFVELLKKYFV